jgi:hypothetical protein
MLNEPVQPICPKCSEHLVLMRTAPFKEFENITLPLLATGLGALGLFSWRGKRNNTAALAA